MADSTIRYIFFLMLVMIIVSYFVGAATETTALANGFAKITYALTGRSASGVVQGYPSGAGTAIVN